MNKASINIEINKERNTTELLSSTLRFLKDNFKIIFLSTLCSAIPIIVICIAYSAVQVLDELNIEHLDLGVWDLNIILMIFEIFGIATLILLYASANSIVVNYIQIDNPKKMKLSHVWAKMQIYLWQYFALGFLVVLFIHVILYVCSEGSYILEGIIKLVSLVLIISFVLTFLYSGIITIQDKYSLTKSWSSSFKLVKKHPWKTLSFLLLYGVVGSVAFTIISKLIMLPLLAFELMDVDFYLDQEYYLGIESNIVEDLLPDVLSLVLYLILILFACFLFSAFTIGTAMKYFSLKKYSSRDE